VGWRGREGVGWRGREGGLLFPTGVNKVE